VFDDGAGYAIGPAPRRHRRERGVYVQQIVERQLFAVQLLQVADAGLVRRIQRGCLVGIFAVAQLLAALERERNALGPAGPVLQQIIVDGGVVRGGVGKDLRG